MQTVSHRQRGYVSPRLLPLLLAAVPWAWAAVGHAQATVTWDGSTNTTWTQPDSTSWSGATYQSGDTAVFAGSGTGTVTITGTVTPGQINVTSASYTLSGVIGGTGGIAKSGSGTLTLAGSLANTYAGATTISQGTLSLNKSSGVVAVPGNLTMSGSGTIVSLPSNLNGQIGDTAAVTVNAPGGVFNGTAFGATTGARQITDTIGSLTVSAGQFNTGGNSSWTVSGAGLIDGTAPSADTRFVAFSGSLISFDSLTLQGMNDQSTTAIANRGFFLGGSSGSTQTTLTVGGNGLALSNSVVRLSPGTGAGEVGSRLVLGGDVTVSGTAGSQIIRLDLSGTGSADVRLSSTSGTVTRTFTVADATSSAAADLTVTASISNGAATAATLAKAGAGTMLLSSSNTYSGGTTISDGTLQIGNANGLGAATGSLVVAGGTLDLGGLSVTRSGTISISGGAIQNGTITNDTLVFDGRSGTASAVLAGTAGLTKTTSGTLVLSGSNGNTYAGLTNVSGGVLTLGKSSGDAIGGDLTISGSSSVTFLQSNQIANTAVVQVTGGHFNGTGPNVGAFSNIIETIGQLHVSGTSSSFSAGNGGNWTVSGAMSFTGGSGATFVGNSGATLTAGSLSLTGMTGVAGGTVGAANSFTVYGNGPAALTTLTVGSGGLALDNSRLNLRRGALAGAQGSRLVLNGGVTVTGTAASLIAEDTAGGTLGIRDVQLSSTAGSHVRTFTVADVTSSVAPDLTVSVPITNGAATAGGLTKAGLGTLLLSAANTYSGDTTISAGTLALGADGSFATSPMITVGGTGSSGAVLDLTAKTGTFSFSSGQTVGGIGTITMDALDTARFAGILAPGNSAGILTFDGGTALLSGTTQIEIFGATRGTGYDAIDLINSAAIDYGNGVLALDFGSWLADQQSYQLFGNGSSSLLSDLSSVTIAGTNYAGLTFSGSNGVWTSQGTSTSGQTLTFTEATGTLVIVPEPAGLAGCGVGLVMAWAFARRRRR